MDDKMKEYTYYRNAIRNETVVLQHAISFIIYCHLPKLHPFWKNIFLYLDLNGYNKLLFKKKWFQKAMVCVYSLKVYLWASHQASLGDSCKQISFALLPSGDVILCNEHMTIVIEPDKWFLKSFVDAAQNIWACFILIRNILKIIFSMMCLLI